MFERTPEKLDVVRRFADTTVSPVDGGAYVTAQPTDGAYRLEIAPAP